MQWTNKTFLLLLTPSVGKKEESDELMSILNIPLINFSLSNFLS
jgi:hypothetical protein